MDGIKFQNICIIREQSIGYTCEFPQAFSAFIMNVGSITVLNKNWMRSKLYRSLAKQFEIYFGKEMVSGRIKRSTRHNAHSFKALTKEFASSNSILWN